MVDAAAARAAVVRPLLAHARVAVRWQVGALELARGAPPDAAAHAVRAKLRVLQVIEPLQRLTTLQSLGDRLRQREAVLGGALDDAGVAVEDTQQAADGNKGFQVDCDEEEPPPSAFDRPVAASRLLAV